MSKDPSRTSGKMEQAALSIPGRGVQAVGSHLGMLILPSIHPSIATGQANSDSTRLLKSSVSAVLG